MNASRAKLLEQLRLLLERLPDDREPVVSMLAVRHVRDADRTSVIVGHGPDVNPDDMRFALSAIAHECVTRGAAAHDVLDAGEEHNITHLTTTTKDKPS